MGTIAVLLDDDMPTAGPNGKGMRVTPYTKIWNRTSITLDTGVGLLEGGANAISSSLMIRNRNWGVSGQLSYLWQDDEYLIEGDFGPTFFCLQEFCLRYSAISSHILRKWRRYRIWLWSSRANKYAH